MIHRPTLYIKGKYCSVNIFISSMLLAGWCGLTYFLKVQSHQLLDIVLGSIKLNQYFLWNR
jgi:hypothetical protein